MCRFKADFLVYEENPNVFVFSSLFRVFITPARCGRPRLRGERWPSATALPALAPSLFPVPVLADALQLSLFHPAPNMWARNSLFGAAIAFYSNAAREGLEAPLIWTKQ